MDRSFFHSVLRAGDPSGRAVLAEGETRRWLLATGVSQDTVPRSSVVTLIDLETGELLGQTEPLGPGVSTISADAGGNWFIAGFIDGSLMIGAVDAPEQATRWKGHEESVLRVGISRDGSRAVSISRNACIREWDVASGAITREGAIDGYENLGQAVFSDDLRNLVARHTWEAMCVSTQTMTNITAIELGSRFGMFIGLSGSQAIVVRRGRQPSRSYYALIFPSKISGFHGELQRWDLERGQMVESVRLGRCRDSASSSKYVTISRAIVIRGTSTILVQSQGLLIGIDADLQAVQFAIELPQATDELVVAGNSAYVLRHGHGWDTLLEIELPEMRASTPLVD